jgi:CRISPR-associated protein Cas5t
VSDPLCLLVEVPVCAFRPYASREYQDTYPVPTPSSVYGMLLALVGDPPVPNASVDERHRAKLKHRGVEMALALDHYPERSRVFRKLRRGNGVLPGEKGCRPDYQDLLIDLRLWVWLRQGKDPATPSLAERVRAGLADPPSITRFGGLSLGESSYLVDTISITAPPTQAHFVIPDLKGFYSLPVWVDHTGPAPTLTRRFRIGDGPHVIADVLPTAWFRIGD